MRAKVLGPVLLTSAAALALGLAACASPAPPIAPSAAAPVGDASTSASAAPSITAAATFTTACRLLAQKEAEAIVGTTLSAGVEGVPSDPSCSYDPDPKPAKTAQVRVVVGDGAKKTYDIDVSLDREFTDVAGVGDEAPQEDSAIFFRKGALWGGITIVSLDDVPATEQQLRDGAEVVVSRMP